MLHDLSQFRQEPKEYILHKTTRDDTSRRAPSAFIFSEKDMPGFKSRAIPTFAVDGEIPMTQARSYLYEDNQKELRKKENKKRWEPYGRKAIPSRQIS